LIFRNLGDQRRLEGKKIGVWPRTAHQAFDRARFCQTDKMADAASWHRDRP
jgi:hypothetical protein